ncbi:MAG: YitT family protein [Oscillospiraceae bacterium]|nr:YitT family protein [Oscillospiraceae bacterium]
MSKKVRAYVVDIALIVFACALYSLVFDLFLEPNQMNGGGVSGLAMVISSMTGALPTGTITLLINLPLFLAGFRRIGKKFFFESLLGTAALSFFLDLFQGLPTPVTDPLLAALYGGAGIGVACGLILARGASTGGTDILMRLMKRRFRNVSAGKLMMAIDLAVIIITGIAFRDVNKTLYSTVTLVISSKLLDSVVYGFDYSKVALIISDRYEKILPIINEKLDRGTTLLRGEGGFTREEKRVILCAIKRQQLAELKELVAEADPNAFIILQEAHQILGEGFGYYSKDSL